MSAIRELWADCRDGTRQVSFLDDLLGVVVDRVHERFEESLVLTRAMLSVPFHSLPQSRRVFAERVARSIHLEDALDPETPILSLLATRGCEEGWNDPERSRGHLALPLFSHALMDSIPMVSRVLLELGDPGSQQDVRYPASAVQSLGAEAGYFHVEDAVSARDEADRLVIPAQGFVTAYSVKSVFAVGGMLFGGALLVLLFFSRDRVEARTVRTFMPLVNLLKAVAITRCSMLQVFRPSGPSSDLDRVELTSGGEHDPD